MDFKSQTNQFAGLEAAFEHDPAIEHSNTPLWREIAWPAEWLQLRYNPVYYGVNVARGKGQPVLLVPGFMAGDLLMLEMHRWLRRIGYRSSLSHIVWNNDCPDATAKRLLDRARNINHRTGQKINIIGHSLGGMISRYLVQEEPELFDRVITLGSPFKSLIKAHPAVIGIWDKLKLSQGELIGRNLKPSCATGHCTCGFVASILRPKSVQPPQYAVYSKKDGVADWESCLEDDSSMNREVNCTHIGMVVHAGVYRAVAEILKQDRTAQPSYSVDSQ